MKKRIYFVPLSLVLGIVSAFAGQPYVGPPGGPVSLDANQEIFARYCTGIADSVEIPGVNWSHPKVRDAAKVLSTISDYSLYYYSGPAKAYGAKSYSEEEGGYVLAPAPAEAPEGTNEWANAFLIILCGEFRDRATMIEAKLNWVVNMHKLPVTEQASIDPTRNVWRQLSAHSYRDYLNFSSELWYEKSDRETPKHVQLGEFKVDAAVNGNTVCETKYILSQYIGEGKSYPGYDEYMKGYGSFQTTYCSQDDLDTYYNFRGDSNFKPNTPESNGMIWYSSSVTRHCKSPGVSKRPEKVSDQECADYFRRPFRQRYSAARAGMSVWLFRDRKHDDVFAGDHNSVVIRPHRDSGLQPFGFSFDSDGTILTDFIPEWLDDSRAYSSPDIGFNQLMGLGTDQPDRGFAYSRIRDNVNRHTDWYSSGFEDGIGMSRSQAYSPFVASSYEMSESDSFTAPGTTVNAPSDGRKHWMYVFKVRRKDWYTTQRLAKGEPVNFDTMWLDETSFGTNGLAKSEKAWDRLGTALEHELAEILYLHNITVGGSVKPDAAEMPKNARYLVCKTPPIPEDFDWDAAYESGEYPNEANFSAMILLPEEGQEVTTTAAALEGSQQVEPTWFETYFQKGQSEVRKKEIRVRASGRIEDWWGAAPPEGKSVNATATLLTSFHAVVDRETLKGHFATTHNEAEDGSFLSEADFSEADATQADAVFVECELTKEPKLGEFGGW